MQSAIVALLPYVCLLLLSILGESGSYNSRTKNSVSDDRDSRTFARWRRVWMEGRRTLVGRFDVDRLRRRNSRGTRAKFKFFVSSLAKEHNVSWSSVQLFEPLHSLQSRLINILLLELKYLSHPPDLLILAVPKNSGRGRLKGQG